MSRTILYYPNISIPTGSWLRNALLYWDKVSSIIPQSYNGELLKELSPDITFLRSEGYFRPIAPEDLIFKQDNWQIFEEFQREFREKVQSSDFARFKAERNFSNNHLSKIAPFPLLEIHANKTTNELFYFLEELGLATIDRKNPGWLLFETTTALLYMALLAKYLADIDSASTSIGTDLSVYESFNFKGGDKNESFLSLNIEFNNLLPTPNPSVSIRKIIDFKVRRADNLINFRKLLLNFQTRLATAESVPEIKDLTNEFRETVIVGVRDLKAAMTDSNIEFVLKSTKSLIDIKEPTLYAAIGTYLAERNSLIHAPIVSEVLGVATMAALQVGTSYIESRNKQRAEIRNSPFSYVYYAQKARIYC